VRKRYVFVQRGNRAVKLPQVIVGVFVCVVIHVPIRLVISKGQVTVCLYQEWRGNTFKKYFVGTWGIRISRIVHGTSASCK